MARPRIAVVLEGGLVARVVSDDPALIGADIVVLDYDTDGCSPDRLTPVKQSDGTLVEGFVHAQPIHAASIDLRHLYNEVEAPSRAADNPGSSAAVAALG